MTDTHAYETIEQLREKLREKDAEIERLKASAVHISMPPMPEGMEIIPYCQVHKTHWLGPGNVCTTCRKVFEPTDTAPEPAPPVPSDLMGESGV